MGVALVLAGVLIPVTVPVVPEALAGPGDAAVQAQSSIESGTADPCPSNPPGDWKVGGVRGEECVLAVDACPQSPVTGDVMVASVTGYPRQTPLRGRILRYPHFCEHQILEKLDPAGYSTCTTRAGYVVMIHPMEKQLDAHGDVVLDADGNPLLWNMCRLLTTPTCSFGLHRVDSATCKVVTRRTWQCPSGTLPRNEFNSCYRPQPPAGTQHPACGPGAPGMVALDCEDYVGDDYARTPMARACADFDTGATSTALSANTLAGSSAVWWCEFNPNHLKAVCHSAVPPAGECGSTVARCLKRASEEGGCDSIARTILCRAQQGSGTLTTDDGCAPCVVLPFESDLSECPDEFHKEPNTGPSCPGDCFYDTMHRVKESFFYDAYDCRHVRDRTVQGGLDDHGGRCRDQAFCNGTAPEGSLTWTSGHGSGAAIVDAPVVLRIDDLPSRTITKYQTFFYWSSDRTTDRVEIYLRNYLAFDNSNDPHGDDSLVRIWPKMDPNTTYSEVRDFLDDSGDVGEACLIRGKPQLRVTIRELRPDDPEDHAEILRLFGPGSLEWWDSLSAADKRRRTEALGLTYWDDLATDADRASERSLRSTELSEEIPCDIGNVYWCRWMPRRPGYYTAAAGGAWQVAQPERNRSWRSCDVVGLAMPIFCARLAGYLERSVSALQAEVRRRGLTMEELGLRIGGIGHVNGNSNTYGIGDSKNNNRWLNDDTEWLYSDLAGQQYRCPSTDLRVTACGTPKRAGNYTRTPSIGIEVHEIRAATRAPNR